MLHESNISFFEWAGFFEPENGSEMKTPGKRLQLEDLDPNDPVRLQAEGAATRETDVRLPSIAELPSAAAQNFCGGCGAVMSHGDDFCPNCGRPSKKLRVPGAQKPESEPERALAYREVVEPQLVGRLNVAGVTVEVFEDQQVVILTPRAVSFTVDKLGSETMGMFEVRLSAVS